MRLYFWNNPYKVAYGMSMVYAVAESIEQANQLARDGKAYSFGEYPEKTPKVELGLPDRIVDLPCAEWHEWSE